MTAAKNRLKVVILDDEAAVETTIRAKLPKNIIKSATTINPDDITPLVKELGNRMAAARKGAISKPKKTELDDADLFIVDYDLVKAKNEDYLTGETVAYLARCYSTCGAIIALNQFWRQPTFDLTLRSQLDSFAELNITADELNNTGLWKERGWKGYRPWSWPVVPGLIVLMRKRVADVEKVKLNTRVVDFLEFPKSVVERLSTSSLELLGSQATKAEAATLKDILGSPQLGLRGKEAADRKRSGPQDSRIIAARLTAWLNMVLTPQDVFVDAPHLAERCPSTIARDPTVKALSKTLLLDPDLSIFKDKKLDQAKFKKAFWFDRPVWYWPEIERLRLTEEIRSPWETKQSRYVFCEDTSSFEPRTSSKAFQSDLISPYRTRFVSRVAKIEYQPAHRLAIS